MAKKKAANRKKCMVTNCDNIAEPEDNNLDGDWWWGKRKKVKHVYDIKKVRRKKESFGVVINRCCVVALSIRKKVDAGIRKK